MQVGDRIGNYAILEVITPEVPYGTSKYLARRAENEAWAHEVALEVLGVDDLDRSFVRVLLDESRLGFGFVHRNVARLVDLGLDGMRAFIATEHVAGATLAELQGRVPLDVAIAIAREVCAGLHYLHEVAASGGEPLGVVHGQVSPNNVQVGCDGSVKLHGGRYLRVLGSPRQAQPRRDDLLYLSPEQCLGRSLDRRSDIYSLARVVWELTTGAVPYPPELSEYEVFTQIAKREPRPPSAVQSGYPPELERIVLRALQRDPAARHATADELQVELGAFARARSCDASARDIARFMHEAMPDRAARASRLR